MASNFNMASLLANMRMPEGVNPVVVNLPSPPKLEGALAPNSVLSKAVRFADNMVQGPESLVLANGYVYTGLSDGWLVEINPQGQVRKILQMSINSCGRPNAPEDACGRPLGLRVDKGYLIVADAYNGIFRVNPVNGRFRQLVNARLQRVNGKPLGFINDLAVAKDGSIFFTSSSTKYTRKEYLDVILEGETSGRVLVYNPRIRGPNNVQELVTNLNFPNGLELSKNEDYLLIAEGGRCRIFKAYIGANSPKRGTIEKFAENLPGFVDNIRRTPRGSYWVGLSRVRHAGLPSVLDEYGNQPKMRGAILGLPRNTILQQAPKYGMVVELGENGKVLRSLQDPTGDQYVAVSELKEENGILYIGSFDKPYVGKLRLADLPPIYKPPGGQPTTVAQQLAMFLQQVREKLMNMNNAQIRDIVITLVQRLVEAKLEALQAESRANQLQKQVEQLQQRLQSTTTPTPAVALTTTPSSPVVTTTTPAQTPTPTSTPTPTTTPTLTTTPTQPVTTASTTQSGGGTSPSSSTTTTTATAPSTTTTSSVTPSAPSTTTPSTGDASSSTSPASSSTTTASASTESSTSTAAPTTTA